MPFLNFLKYNNAVPVTVAIVMLGGGAAFAASDPDLVYSSSESVISIDNTYLVGKDLTAYSPVIQITGVTEDSEYYYTAYKLFSIDLSDSVWKDVARDEVMQVSKSDLGAYRDLGVYVTEKMKDIVSRESQRLRDTQAVARTNVTQKVVATEYGGLIGQLLDTRTEQLPGYTPVVQPEAGIELVESIPPQLPRGDESLTGVPSDQAPQANPSSSGLALKVLGLNPSEIPIGSTYSDLGAVIVSPLDSNLGVKVFLDGVEMQQISLDTSKVNEWIVTYTVTDGNGNSASTERTVRVYDPYTVITPTTEPDTSSEGVAPTGGELPASETQSDTMPSDNPAAQADVSGDTSSELTPDDSVE